MLAKSKRFQTSLHIFIFLLIVAAVLFGIFSIISIRTNVSVIDGAISLGKSILTGTFLAKLGEIESSLASIYKVVIIEIIVFAGAVIASLFALNYLIDIYFEATRRSMIDELTGVYNRRALYKILDQEIMRAERFKHPLSVAMLDIDHFKDFNDRNGHLLGDVLLKKMSRIIQRKIRDVDTFARYGGEEFIVILPETPHAGAMRAAERIRKAVEEGNFEGEENQPGGKVTISIGLVTFHGEYKGRKQLIDSADALLYQAKLAGRNRVVKAYYHSLEEDSMKSS